MSDDDLLNRLRAEGHDLDLRDAVIDVEATLKKLRRLGHETSRLRLPSGVLGQRRKLAKLCQDRGVDPVYCD